MVWVEQIRAYFANEYVAAAAILILGIIFAKLFEYIFVGIFKKLTEKTETDLDDLILAIARRPLFVLILLGSLYLALRSISAFDADAAWVDGTFYILLVLILFWMLSRIFALITTRWFQMHTDAEGSPKLLNIIASIIIYIAALIMILSHFNVEITPLVAALGVGGLAIGLALQDTLGNVFAGIHIISDQPVRVKDIVELQGQNIVGEVVDIGWRSTRIRTFANNVVIVPNSVLAGSIVTNYELDSEEVRAIVECGVDYNSNLQKVEKVALEVAKEVQAKVPEAVKKFEPSFRFHTFADSNINFRVIMNAKSRQDKFIVEHEFIKRLHTRFAKEGIEISWPVRKVYTDPKPSKKSNRK